jgi:hypothetical protein
MALQCHNIEFIGAVKTCKARELSPTNKFLIG